MGCCVWCAMSSISVAFWCSMPWIRSSRLCSIRLHPWHPFLSTRYGSFSLPCTSPLIWAKLRYLVYHDITLLTSQLKRPRRWPVRPEHPQWAPQTIRTICLRARQRQPAFVDFVRFTRIDIHIAVTVSGVSCFYCHFLVPAMHAADRIRMDRKGQVLMHAALAPEDARRVGIGALKGLYALQVAQTPRAVLFAP